MHTGEILLNRGWHVVIEHPATSCNPSRYREFWLQARYRWYVSKQREGLISAFKKNLKNKQRGDFAKKKGASQEKRRSATVDLLTG